MKPFPQWVCPKGDEGACGFVERGVALVCKEGDACQRTIVAGDRGYAEVAEFYRERDAEEARRAAGVAPATSKLPTPGESAEEIGEALGRLAHGGALRHCKWEALFVATRDAYIAQGRAVAVGAIVHDRALVLERLRDALRSSNVDEAIAKLEILKAELAGGAS